MPKISIITIVYNRVFDIEYTINSVLQQSFQDREYIIIDGGSTDGTVDIIQKYATDISCILSERDNGIYDAMNKGLLRAKGEYVCFLNGGDEFHNKEVLKRIFEITINQDILFGESMCIDVNRSVIEKLSIYKGKPLPERATISSFRYGSSICHQSFIVKKEIAPFFDIQYKLSSDIDWMLNCMKSSTNSLNTGIVISNFLLGGASKQYHLRSLLERTKIFSHHYGLTKTLYYHVCIIYRFLKK